MKRGKEFESSLIRYINERRFPVVSVSEFYTDETVKQTIDLMKDGVPIIHSAPLKNRYNSTGGIADLIVRSDYLEQIVEKCPLSDAEKLIGAPKLNAPYHYRVIDVKFSTLPLCADGVHLRNDGFYKAYKSQLYIYNQAIGLIQGYTPPCAYILGRRWKYTSRGETYQGFSCLERLGVVNFDGPDHKYRSLTQKALRWVRDVQTEGHSWSLYPPSRPELYPNMCVDSGEWMKEKENVARNLADITMLWYCGIRQRNVAFSHGVKSWRDSNCSSSVMGVHGCRAPIIDAIIDINRQSEDIIRPARIMNNLGGWKDVDENELYVDFETFSDIFTPFTELPSQEPFTISIYMIGVGWREDGEFRYRSFIANELTKTEEFRIMDEFAEFVRQRGNPPLYYWHAEKQIWSHSEEAQAETRNFPLKVHIADNWELGNWVDLSQIFKQEPIVIKGCFNYGLKSIVKSMYFHGLITTRLESECDSGLSAMVRAWRCYQRYNNPSDAPVMRDIERYNIFDCQALHDILWYLRREHI